MTPISYFESVWERCSHLSALHAFLSKQLTAAIEPHELLRAEWVTRVSALDLYVHELVAQRMVEIFEGRRAPSNAYLRFQIPNETIIRMRKATSPTDASSAFDLEVRSRLSILTFQDPTKIADGIRLVSDVDLWNTVALLQGATPATKTAEAKILKRKLSIIVERRNKIAHEGDLQPTVPRAPWPINIHDLQQVEAFIRGIVDALEQI